jgi:hypothetical protein
MAPFGQTFEEEMGEIGRKLKTIGAMVPQLLTVMEGRMGVGFGGAGPLAAVVRSVGF